MTLGGTPLCTAAQLAGAKLLSQGRKDVTGLHFPSPSPAPTPVAGSPNHSPSPSVMPHLTSLGFLSPGEGANLADAMLTCKPHTPVHNGVINAAKPPILKKPAAKQVSKKPVGKFKAPEAPEASTCSLAPHDAKQLVKAGLKMTRKDVHSRAYFAARAKALKQGAGDLEAKQAGSVAGRTATEQVFGPSPRKRKFPAGVLEPTKGEAKDKGGPAGETPAGSGESPNNLEGAGGHSQTDQASDDSNDDSNDESNDEPKDVKPHVPTVYEDID